jgi:hypothetical protein
MYITHGGNFRWNSSASFNSLKGRSMKRGKEVFRTVNLWVYKDSIPANASSINKKGQYPKRNDL